MKTLSLLTGLLLTLTIASCDLRSGTAKDEMEKFNGPAKTPAAPAPTEAPIDPADIVEVDIGQQGDTITVNGYDNKKNLVCNKLERVMISGRNNQLTIKGPCRQVMINGDGNTVKLDAAIDVTFNGSDNIVEFSRYVNGKRPITNDNGDGNSIEKVAAAATNDKPGSNSSK